MKNEACKVQNRRDGALRNILHFPLCTLHSDGVGLLFPVNHAPMKNGVPDRLRSGDLLHERQADGHQRVSLNAYARNGG